MKKLLIVLSIICFYSSKPFAQVIDVSKIPVPVKNEFASKFPEAKEVAWEKDGNDYEASFKLGSKEYSALFNQSGNLKETEIKIKQSELPATVLSSLENKFSGTKISEAERIEFPDKTVRYELDVVSKGTNFELIFSPEGKLIEQKKKKKEENEKD